MGCGFLEENKKEGLPWKRLEKHPGEGLKIKLEHDRKNKKRIELTETKESFAERQPLVLTKDFSLLSEPQLSQSQQLLIGLSLHPSQYSY